jgi:hypothetical protein
VGAARPIGRASARQVVQQRRQRNIYAASGVVGVVVVMIVLLIVLSLGGTTSPKVHVGSDSYALSASLINEVTGVPVSALVASAKTEPSGTAPPQELPAKNALLTQGGKPEILYMGGEYCPYCAAERWALVMALSKFGTFSGLRGTTSSATDVYASSPTFSFYGSSYTSKYLSFVPVELYTNIANSNGWGTLQKPTAEQSALLNKWDAPPYTSASEAGGIPFVYLAGRYVLTGPQFVAPALSGKQFEDAAAYLTSGKNSGSKDAEAAAGYLVGDFCAITHKQPAGVCSQVPASLIGINMSSPSSRGSTSTTKAATSPTTTGAKTATTLGTTTAAKTATTS